MSYLCFYVSWFTICFFGIAAFLSRVNGSGEIRYYNLSENLNDVESAIKNDILVKTMRKKYIKYVKLLQLSFSIAMISIIEITSYVSLWFTFMTE